MKSRDFVSILLKLMAFYVFTQFLLNLPATLQWLMISRSAANNLAGMSGGSLTLLCLCLFVISFAYLVFSIGLFFAAHKLSYFFVEKHDEDVSLSGAVSEGLQTWSFRCFGVYAVVTWGPSLVQTLCRTVVYGTWQLEQVPFWRRFYDNWSMLVSPATGVAFGLFLIFKAKGLLRLIQLSRPMSRQHAELEAMNEHLQSEPSDKGDARE